MPKVPKAKVQSFKGFKAGGPLPVPSNVFGSTVGAKAAAPTASGPSGFGQAKVSAALGGPTATQTAGAAPTGFSPVITGIRDQAKTNAAATLRDTVGGITQNQDRAANDFGFKVRFKPTVGANGERQVDDGPDAITVDPSNPFSRAALLQRSYDNAKRGTTNSMAAAGQLYSGALQNAQNENARGFQQGDNALRQAFVDFFSGQESNRAAAVRTASEASVRAEGDALSAQLATTPDDPGPGTPPTAAPAAAGPKKGYAYLMKSGPYAGQSYNIITGAKGNKVRVFANGKRQGID